MSDFKYHWDNIYQNSTNSHSWTQLKPETTLSLISSLNLPKDVSIIDVGGGDGYLVDHLLDLGFTNISVLDISSVALENAIKRLGYKQNRVKWINSDILNFTPEDNYDLWIDRAVFHFLQNKEEINHYKSIAANSIKTNGHLIVATFSEKGPEKCSGLSVKQYSKNELKNTFEDPFILETIITEDHYTPNSIAQNFIYCFFSKTNHQPKEKKLVKEEYRTYYNNNNSETSNSCDITKRGCCN